MMNRRWILALIVVLLAGCTGFAQSAKERLLAEREIRALLDMQADAWNRRDLEGYMAGYWRSDELTFYSNATETRGWQATLDRYRKTYQGEGKEMGTLSFTDLKIDVWGPAAAMVRGKWRLKMDGSQPGGIFTLVLRKFPEGWRIIHDHTGGS